jgi:hypothetical protein
MKHCELTKQKCGYAPWEQCRLSSLCLALNIAGFKKKNIDERKSGPPSDNLTPQIPASAGCGNDPYKQHST